METEGRILIPEIRGFSPGRRRNHGVIATALGVDAHAMLGGEPVDEVSVGLGKRIEVSQNDRCIVVTSGNLHLRNPLGG